MRQVQIIRPDGRTIVVGGDGSAGPRSAAELRALHIQRDEISSQLGELQRRRNDVEERMHVSSGPTRSALEQQVLEIDARRLALQGQVDRINDRIASAQPSAYATTTERPGGAFERALADELIPVTAILSVFVLFPLALAFARLMWKRATSMGQRPALNDQALAGRLEQLQTSMDAMALEVERISEGQRYVTKLMAEKEKAALPR